MKNNIIEKIALSMMNELDATYDVPDIEIINSIMLFVKDLEQVDRDGRTLLVNAACYGRKNVLEFLINKGANVNASDKMGFTAMHFAAQENHADIIRILLKNGADINARNAFGNPPIFCVRLPHAKELYKLLMENGADPNIKNNFGVSTRDTHAAYPDLLKILNGEE